MRGGVLVVFAVVVGMVAAGLIYARLNRSDATEHTIVVAVQDIAAGEAIHSEQLKEIRWGGATLPTGVFDQASKVVGRIARVEIAQGQMIAVGALAQPNAMSGLTSVIQDGRRAISIAANEVSGVAGFITPGSYVDLLVSGKDADQQPFSKIVLERVRVLAVEQDTKSNPQQPRVVRAVTLELTPMQAERLDLARAVGTLSLALRNEFDHQPTNSRGARMLDIMTGSGYAEPAPRASDAAPASHAAAPSRAAGSRRPVHSDQTLRPTGGAVEEIHGTSSASGPM